VLPDKLSTTSPTEVVLPDKLSTTSPTEVVQPDKLSTTSQIEVVQPDKLSTTSPTEVVLPDELSTTSPIGVVLLSELSVTNDQLGQVAKNDTVVVDAQSSHVQQQKSKLNAMSRVLKRVTQRSRGIAGDIADLLGMKLSSRVKAGATTDHVGPVPFFIAMNVDVPVTVYCSDIKKKSHVNAIMFSDMLSRSNVNYDDLNDLSDSRFANKSSPCPVSSLNRQDIASPSRKTLYFEKYSTSLMLVYSILILNCAATNLPSIPPIVIPPDSSVPCSLIGDSSPLSVTGDGPHQVFMLSPSRTSCAA
jgi:hypothetical protein